MKTIRQRKNDSPAWPQDKLRSAWLRLQNKFFLPFTVINASIPRIETLGQNLRQARISLNVWLRSRLFDELNKDRRRFITGADVGGRRAE